MALTTIKIRFVIPAKSIECIALMGLCMLKNSIGDITTKQIRL